MPKTRIQVSRQCNFQGENKYFLKIVFISQYNVFSSIGGTESYLDILIRSLVERKHEIVLITKGEQKLEIKTEYYILGESGYKCVFLSNLNFEKREIAQRKVSATWEPILSILEQEMPDIIHVHTYSTFFNIRHFEKCKERFTNIFFTSHIPANFCPQGDLIKFMKKPCDGVLYQRCSLCLFSRSLKEGLSNLLFSNWQRVLQRLKTLDSLGVKLVCVSEWQKQHALNNGFSKDNVYVIRQAIVTKNYQTDQKKYIEHEFTIGYLGRLAPEKGAPLLLEVIRALLVKSDFRFVLGIPIENCSPEYVLMLKKLSLESKGRIIILENVDSSNKEIFFQQLDCLFIPSFFLETGPIVLLEALIFNKHVVAPNVGGPLEYKKIFQESITLYEWNHLQSASSSLELVSKSLRNDFDNFSILKEREKSFVRNHEDLYFGSIHNQYIVPSR